MIFHDICKIKGKTVKLIYAGHESTIVETRFISKPLGRYGFCYVEFMNIQQCCPLEIKKLICNKCLRIVDNPIIIQNKL